MWGRYLAADPGLPPPLPREEDWVPPPAVRRAQAMHRLAARAGGATVALAGVCSPTTFMGAFAFGVVAIAVILALGLRTWMLKARRAQALAALMKAKQAWQVAVQDWHVKAKAPDLSGERRAIEGLKAKIDALAPEREARLKALARPIGEPEQRSRYLGQFRIEDARLFNLGPARCAVLRSWGIDTAADVSQTKVADIPGFGRNLTERLVNWADGLHRQFRFEPASTVDPVEVQKLDRDLAARRINLMKELRNGIGSLEGSVNSVYSNRSTSRTRLEAAFNTWMLARHAVACRYTGDPAG